MVQRKIVHINEALCNGCGTCIPKCAEGALQIVNGKAKMIKETYCDGLGACLGQCPQGAITITEREAPAFDEEEVHEYLRTKSQNPLQVKTESSTAPQKPQWPVKTQPSCCKNALLRKRKPSHRRRLRTNRPQRLSQPPAARQKSAHRLPQIRRR